jgi:hypothetical protein
MYTILTILLLMVLVLGASLAYCWRQLLRLGYAHDQLTVDHGKLRAECMQFGMSMAAIKVALDDQKREVIQILNSTQDRMDRLEKYVKKECGWGDVS